MDLCTLELSVSWTLGLVEFDPPLHNTRLFSGRASAFHERSGTGRVFGCMHTYRNTTKAPFLIRHIVVAMRLKWAVMFGISYTPPKIEIEGVVASI